MGTNQITTHLGDTEVRNTSEACRRRHKCARRSLTPLQTLSATTPNWQMFDEKLQRLSENNEKIRKICKSFHWETSVRAMYIPALGPKHDTNDFVLDAESARLQSSDHDIHPGSASPESSISSEYSAGFEEAWAALQEGLDKFSSRRSTPSLSSDSEYDSDTASITEAEATDASSLILCTDKDQHHQHGVPQTLPTDTEATNIEATGAEWASLVDELHEERLTVLDSVKASDDDELQADDEAESDSGAAKCAQTADELHATRRLVFEFMDVLDWINSIDTAPEPPALFRSFDENATWSAAQIKTSLETSCGTVASLLRKDIEPSDELLEATARICKVATKGGLLRGMSPVPPLVSDDSDCDSDSVDDAISSEKEPFHLDRLVQRYSLSPEHDKQLEQDDKGYSSSVSTSDDEDEHVKAANIPLPPSPQRKKKRVTFDAEAMQAPEDGPELTWRNADHRAILRAREDNEILNAKVDEVLSTMSHEEIGARIKTFVKLQETVGLDAADAFLMRDQKEEGTGPLDEEDDDDDDEVWRQRALDFNSGAQQPKTQRANSAVPDKVSEDEAGDRRSWFDDWSDEDEVSEGRLKRVSTLILKRVASLKPN